MDDFYVPFGRMINLQTRRGNIDLLSDVYEEAQERAHEGLNRFLSEKKNRGARKISPRFSVRKSAIDHAHVSRVIGKAYLILTDFSRPRRTDYVFSWHEIASKDGIAFLLLYCHARLCRSARKNVSSGRNVRFPLFSLEREVRMPVNWSANVELLTDRREQMLIQHLAT